MEIELVEHQGKQMVEVNVGGGIVHVLSTEDALKLADWIIEFCIPYKRPEEQERDFRAPPLISDEARKILTETRDKMIEAACQPAQQPEVICKCKVCGYSQVIHDKSQPHLEPKLQHDFQPLSPTKEPEELCRVCGHKLSIHMTHGYLANCTFCSCLKFQPSSPAQGKTLTCLEGLHDLCEGLVCKCSCHSPAQVICPSCGKLRTETKGELTFPFCDECWDKQHSAQVEKPENPYRNPQHHNHYAWQEGWDAHEKYAAALSTKIDREKLIKAIIKAYSRALGVLLNKTDAGEVADLIIKELK